MSIPQVRGMYAGDRARKDILVEHGFRLPSARDNRPLTFDEFDRMLNQIIYVSATPGPFEREVTQRTVEQVIRPTGLSTHPSPFGRPRDKSTTCCARSTARQQERARFDHDPYQAHG